jgi:hypothetical protein
MILYYYNSNGVSVVDNVSDLIGTLRSKGFDTSLERFEGRQPRHYILKMACYLCRVEDQLAPGYSQEFIFSPQERIALTKPEIGLWTFESPN